MIRIDPRLAGVYVVFENLDTGKLTVVKTDYEGKAIVYLEKGTYKVTACKAGYMACATTVSITKPTVITLILAPTIKLCEGVLEETLDYEYFISPAKEAVLEETLDYEYSTSLADVVSPETYEPTGGWDTIWRFTSTLEIDDFANYSKAYTDIDVIDNAKFMVFNPPDGEIGNARRLESDKVWARVGVALKVSLDTMEVATTICSVYTSDGVNYAYVSITTIAGNLSQLKLSEYTGNAQVFDIPPDGYIILIVDFESMTATVYDKDGNVLAQIPIGVTSSDITEAHVGIWEENISGHVVENIDVDWVAVKYGTALGTPSHVLRTADLEETLDYEYSVTTPTAIGTMVKKPTLISFGINI